jgi:hypothetical protein
MKNFLRKNNIKKYFRSYKLPLIILMIIFAITILFFIQKNNLKIESDNYSISNENITHSDQDKNTKYIGYIKNVSSTKNNFYLDIDYVQWISPCTSEKCPNGYVIKNDNPLIRTFPISKNVIIKMQTFSHQTSGVDKGNFNYNEIVSLDKFKGIINGTVIPPSYLDMGPSANPYTGWYNTGSTTQIGAPFWITLNNGIITEITEQYIP